MNIYNMTDKEVCDMHDEFNKTAFGKRAKFFSILPLIGVIISLFFAINGEEAVLFNFFLVNCAFAAVTQMQYGSMLKDYVSSKKDKK